LRVDIAAARRRARGEGPVLLSRYDGQELLGHIHGTLGRFEARAWPSETRLGVFRTRAEACAAIDAAALLGRAKAGRTE
jgi:hypothetical protein